MSRKSIHGSDGALLQITNPTNKVNTVPPEAIIEINQALDVLEGDRKFSFVILHGTADKIHAGADVKMFSGGLTKDQNPPDFEGVRQYLQNGTKLDLRIKRLSQKMTTVSIIQGERFGGSVEWPLMTRYAVAAADAGMSLSEATIGILPGWNGILNILLKSGVQNALFLGTTGRRINAQQMLDAGIVTTVSSPENVMKTALDLAAAGKAASSATTAKKRFATDEELFEILGRRMNQKRYQALVNEMTKVKEAPGADMKELSKTIDRKLEEMGKPLAPLSVEAIFGLIARHSVRISADNLDSIQEMAFDEADGCNALMMTHDRVIGIDSVLKARENPIHKIPLYQRK